ncbi:MAG: dihydropteroate synthase, partial [Bacteroidales bacterium]|nr:dihydropteroate synthase [Bacteroidales bacterium]
MKLKIGEHFFSWERPLVMGILNLTPDSFYDGGSHHNIDDVLKHCEKMLTEGADIIDIGAFSSRPGSEIISVEEENSRLLPYLIEIKKRFPDTIISIDTFRKDVAKNAIENGADIIND